MHSNCLIRNVRQDDLAEMRKICLQTADHGEDGTGLYNYPELLWSFYLDVYLEHEINSCFVLQDDQGLGGYILGAVDTKALLLWVASYKIENLKARFPLEDPDNTRTRADQALVNQLHSQQWLPDILADYPSHLHINILPRLQGQGVGKALISTLITQLRKLKTPAVHLGVSDLNLRAQGFYEHLGFVELGRGPGVIWMGLKLSQI